MKNTSRTLGLALIAATLIVPMVDTAEGANLLLNGDFEADTWGGGLAPESWLPNAFNAATYAPITSGAYLHSGTQSFGEGPQASNNTFPVIYQSFTLAPGTTEMTISGWVKNGPGGIASIRLRENLMGGVGDVRLFDVASNAWITNGSAISQAAGYYGGDAFGMAPGGIYKAHSAQYAQSDWTYFEFTAPVLAGVSTYALDLGAVQFVIAGAPDSSAYWDDISVTAVPEPSQVLLIGLGLGAVIFFRARKKLA